MVAPNQRRGVRIFLVIPAILAGLSEYALLGQQATSSSSIQPASQQQTTLQAFQQQKRALMRQLQALMANGATEDQLQAWYQQNAGQFASLQQQAQEMAAASALQPLSVNRQPHIPANASQMLNDFLTTQAALANARAQIHNQLLRSLPSNATADQISQMQQQETELFQQQNAAALQLQAQRAQTLAQESAQTPLPVPGPLQLPPNISPQLAAYLTARHQLRVERAQLWNQYVNADPATRSAALQQWEQQNAAQIQQLQQQAQNLAQASSSTQD